MIIIPARVASSRFPNKVLADIKGVPMVVATAQRVAEVDDVAIATDAKEVVEIAKRYSIEAVMTSKEHKSGTDRINEAANILGIGKEEVVLNVQADEPFIEPEVVSKVYDLTKSKIGESEVLMCSCYKEITPSLAEDPNLVKVVLSDEAYALYFSRAKIPYDREHQGQHYFGHLGIYGFSKLSLEKFCMLESAPLEDIEKLEQLRALYFGYKIAMVKVESQSFGIDTVEDLQKALQIF